MDSTNVVKWIGIGFVVLLVLAIATGNMGGSREATKNYNKVMTGQ